MRVVVIVTLVLGALLAASWIYAEYFEEPEALHVDT
jgi:hypothetical protein